MAHKVGNLGSPTGVRQKLKKELGLWDVYCISTGTMFSSGFFLLPGLATVTGGPSTVLAYLIAGLLIVPAMFCMAELASALPRAGGAYYFLDRSMGPAVGTIGGMGTWLALVLKAGFALLGMGAYLAIIPGVEGLLAPDSASTLWLNKALAVALAVMFAAVNIFGAKESSRLQSVLVVMLLGVLAFFVVQGLWYVFFRLPEGELARQYTPFLHEQHGWTGLLRTIGLVFVSYAGLTQVASISEEVKRPDRNLPLGMFLSLATVTVIYVVGVFIIIAVLEPDTLRRDYTPVATAANAFFGWLPRPLGLILIVAAAMAAFASTGNAGIMSASRYPLAMARDRLAPIRFDFLGRYGTPTPAILFTTAMMIVFIVAFSAEGVAKLASCFNLLMFGMASLAVIVMRESQIESYDPGFRVPFYPWLPIVGVLISGWLIIEMGWLTIGFSIGVIVLGLLWYLWYARPRVERHGAIHHVFERLGRYRHEQLDHEFREIMKEKGARDRDPFDDIVSRADLIEAEAGEPFEQVIRRVARCFIERLPLPIEEVERRFTESARFGIAPIAHGAVLPHFRSHLLEQSEMVLVRSRAGVCVPPASDDPVDGDADKVARKVNALFFLVSPESEPGRHLRILAQIAGRIEDESFLDAWLAARDHQKLKEVLLRDERYLVLHVGRYEATAPLIGTSLRDVGFPRGTLATMIRREGEIFVPSGSTTLQRGDRLTIIGDPKGIDRLRSIYIEPGSRAKKENN
ncbi:MAG: amino acid permease [Phycisphaerales bacterium]|nr:amino acid permease [Phycisphaerales bacterium]